MVVRPSGGFYGTIGGGALNIQGLHIDLVRAPEQLDEVIATIGPKTVLSVGVVDGRNIWKTDLKNGYRPRSTCRRQTW